MLDEPAARGKTRPITLPERVTVVGKRMLWIRRGQRAIDRARGELARGEGAVDALAREGIDEARRIAHHEQARARAARHVEPARQRAAAQLAAEPHASEAGFARPQITDEAVEQPAEVQVQVVALAGEVAHADVGPRAIDREHPS